MAIIELSHTKTGERKCFEVVEKDYILMTTRLLDEAEAEELLLNEYHKTGEKIRYDLGVNLETGKIELKKLYGEMYVGFNLFIPVLSLDVRRDDIEFFSWIDDELDGLKAYLDMVYIPAS